MLRIIKYLGIITLILSYGLLITNYVLHNSQTYFTPIFNVAWFSGAISVISNAVYAIKTDIGELVLSLYGMCALFWLAPFFSEIDPSYGFPSLIGFAVLVIYIHTRAQSEEKST